MKMLFTDITMDIDGWDFRSISLDSIDYVDIPHCLDFTLNNFYESYNGSKQSISEAVAAVYYDVFMKDYPKDFMSWFHSTRTFGVDEMLYKLEENEISVEFMEDV